MTPFPGPGAKFQVSNEGGVGALWSRDGREILYREDDRFMVVDVSLATTISLGSPRLLFERALTGPASRSGSQTGDAERLLIAASGGTGLDRIEVVLDWFTDLQRVQ